MRWLNVREIIPDNPGRTNSISWEDLQARLRGERERGEERETGREEEGGGEKEEIFPVDSFSAWFSLPHDLTNGFWFCLTNPHNHVNQFLIVPLFLSSALILTDTSISILLSLKLKWWPLSLQFPPIVLLWFIILLREKALVVSTWPFFSQKLSLHGSESQMGILPVANYGSSNYTLKNWRNNHRTGLCNYQTHSESNACQNSHLSFDNHKPTLVDHKTILGYWKIA